MTQTRQFPHQNFNREAPSDKVVASPNWWGMARDQVGSCAGGPAVRLMPVDDWMSRTVYTLDPGLVDCGYHHTYRNQLTQESMPVVGWTFEGIREWMEVRRSLCTYAVRCMQTRDDRAFDQATFNIFFVWPSKLPL